MMMTFKLEPILIKILLIVALMYVMKQRQKSENNNLNLRDFQLLFNPFQSFQIF